MPPVRGFKGDIFYDDTSLTIYSTDASVYSVRPVAVAYPRDKSDISALLRYCHGEGVSLTVRGGGTSLAGQAVGSGIIADLSRYMNRIIDFNLEERWVVIEPGVVLGNLNRFLKPHGLMFGPETSTANRCTIGGMVGNNACGLHSLIYGSTRDHLLAVTVTLSDGSIALFDAVDSDEFNRRCGIDSLEGSLYRHIRSLLGDKKRREIIKENYPHHDIPRRNSGYPLDILAESSPFSKGSDMKFNFAKLIAGSEGTLAVATEIKLNLVPLPPPHKQLVAVHLSEKREAFKANLIALKHSPTAIEMMDDKVLKLAATVPAQRKNRQLIMGEPGAILIVEINSDRPEKLLEKRKALISELRDSGLGYHFLVAEGEDMERLWDLRRAGLGVLSKMEGDGSPISLIEDCAVRVEDLSEYMQEIEEMLSLHNKEVVIHAHIGSGELHLRPVINLKESSEVALLRQIATETAHIIRRYRGSLSGEHGDGRVRSELLPVVLGNEVISMLESLKEAWDPDYILNPGIIVKALPLDRDIRYRTGAAVRDYPTIFDFSDTGGMVRAAERCNGSADCRRDSASGGVMCPTYKATGDERLSTRARANMLRVKLSEPNQDKWAADRDLYDILDLCVSCKGCMAECPSGVDIARLKAEFLYHWYRKHPIPLRVRLAANISSVNRMASLMPSLYNRLISGRFTGRLIKNVLGFDKRRNLPVVARRALSKWAERELSRLNPEKPTGEVVLFIDEFTNMYDTEAGISAILLLTRLKYRVTTIRADDSGRAAISKGLLAKSIRSARKSVNMVMPFVGKGVPVVGIEPSAVLSFRDEYPLLLRGREREAAEKVAAQTFLFEEFILNQYNEGKIDSGSFDKRKRSVFLHPHCHQMALSGPEAVKMAVEIPEGTRVTLSKAGCCGMAGTFGYERKNYDLSVRIAELSLLPEIRDIADESFIVAPGTSCRHQIYEGTGRRAIHPAVYLLRCLINSQTDAL